VGPWSGVVKEEEELKGKVKVIAEESWWLGRVKKLG
jgi:hypothetical protein